MDRTEKEFGLKIRLYYLEEVANKVIDLQFEGDKVKIRAVGTPKLVEFMGKMVGTMEGFHISKRKNEESVIPGE